MDKQTETVEATVNATAEVPSFLSRLPKKKIAYTVAGVAAVLVIGKVVKDALDIDVDVETTLEDSPQS